MSPNFRIKIIYLAFIFPFVFLGAQDYSFLPEPIRTTSEYKRKGDYEGALRFNTKALKQYEENGDTRGIIMVYTNIGNILCGFSRHKESLEYLDKAKNELNTINPPTPLLIGNLYNEYGRNYIRLGLFEQANTAYNKAAYYIKRVTDDKQRNYLLFHNYSGKYTNFLKSKNIDSLRTIEKNCCLRFREHSPTQEWLMVLLRKKHLDSAEYYMNKAVLNFNTANFTEKGIALFSYGDLYNVKGDQKRLWNII
ncbi:MAG: tetratricopeptide repeat protein [Chryseobacterium sp.]|uniref:tetratricopeptide repeat protein n=1 Tax=Chryseobacterium sp. TaxID=1871047 RepID=UPI0025C70F4A|nr:tetratricopeptide repeat protein [Chryseobacterium sp.]MCJ7933290.1 tetratricopeptide repeat protein [Chryseobacterium sp.]